MCIQSEILLNLIALYNNGYIAYLFMYLNEVYSITGPTLTRTLEEKAKRFRDFINLVERLFPGNNYDGGAKVIIDAMQSYMTKSIISSNKEYCFVDLIDDYNTSRNRIEFNKHGKRGKRQVLYYANILEEMLNNVNISNAQDFFISVCESVNFSKKLSKGDKIIFKKCMSQIIL